MNSLIDMSSKQSKLIGLFALALVLLNFPLLSIFHRPSYINGMPTVYLYLFFVWFILIFVMRQNIKSTLKQNKNDTKEKP